MDKPEYLEHRCCMCPNRDTPNKTECPSGPLKPEVTPCRFVKTYVDNRGWIYQVMSGIGQSSYKGRYFKPGKFGRCMQNLPWRDSFDDAQRDLNLLAKSKRWSEDQS